MQTLSQNSSNTSATQSFSPLSSDFFLKALADNAAAIPIRVQQLIASQAAGKAVVASNGLELEEYAQLNLCQLQSLPVPQPDCYRYWCGEDDDQLTTQFNQVLWHVHWNRHELTVLHLEWETGCGGSSRDWVIAESAEIADSFILDLERKTHSPGESILVFSGGHWHRSRAMYRATQSASFEDLILVDNLKETIRNDFSRFLDAEERYRRLGISWRRGALFIGPPGNGKTHCVRALVKELGIASLYVQSLSHTFYTEEQLWKIVFDRARGLTPCVLVLEDLDTLVNDDNRSFFLNQLDGFQQNHGMIVLATSNYPDRIDRAIIDRPSRFDRKYHFNLPSLDERARFLGNWQAMLFEETAWSENQVAPAAKTTDGFSFAYLKELIVSSLLQWIQQPDSPFADVLAEQSRLLKQQMKTEKTRL